MKYSEVTYYELVPHSIYQEVPVDYVEHCIQEYTKFSWIPPESIDKAVYKLLHAPVYRVVDRQGKEFRIAIDPGLRELIEIQYTEKELELRSKNDALSWDIDRLSQRIGQFNSASLFRKLWWVIRGEKM